MSTTVDFYIDDELFHAHCYQMWSVNDRRTRFVEEAWYVIAGFKAYNLSMTLIDGKFSLVSDRQVYRDADKFESPEDAISAAREAFAWQHLGLEL